MLANNPCSGEKKHFRPLTTGGITCIALQNQLKYHGTSLQKLLFKVVAHKILTVFFATKPDAPALLHPSVDSSRVALSMADTHYSLIMS
jgi:hypothetical protein